MRTKNLNILLMLVSGIIVGIISIINKYTVEKLMYTLVYVLIAFFLVGTIMQFLLNRVYDKATKVEHEKIDQDLNEQYEILKQKMENINSETDTNEENND